MPQSNSLCKNELFMFICHKCQLFLYASASKTHTIVSFATSTVFRPESSTVERQPNSKSVLWPIPKLVTKKKEYKIGPALVTNLGHPWQLANVILNLKLHIYKQLQDSSCKTGHVTDTENDEFSHFHKPNT